MCVVGCVGGCAWVGKKKGEKRDREKKEAHLNLM